jgi:hypothetical protein
MKAAERPRDAGQNIRLEHVRRARVASGTRARGVRERST